MIDFFLFAPLGFIALMLAVYVGGIVFSILRAIYKSPVQFVVGTIKLLAYSVGGLLLMHALGIGLCVAAMSPFLIPALTVGALQQGSGGLALFTIIISPIILKLSWEYIKIVGTIPGRYKGGREI